MGLLLSSISIFILTLCLILHFVLHFRLRCCSKHRSRRGQCPCSIVGTGEEGFDFLPLSFVLYSLWSLIASSLILLKFTEFGDSAVYFHGRRPIDWIAVYSAMALSVWEWLFNFYRFLSTHSASRKMVILRPAQIASKFTIFGVIFIAVFTVQIYWIYWLFPLLVICHFVFNAVAIWLFGHILIVQYRFSMATQHYLEHLHDDMLRSVYVMRRLSMCSTITSTITLSLVTAAGGPSHRHEIDTAIYLPALWTVSAIGFTLNFVRNRMFCYSVTEPLRICCRCQCTLCALCRCTRCALCRCCLRSKTTPKIHPQPHSQSLHQNGSLPLELGVVTSSVPSTLPALLTIESGQEMDDGPRHSAFSPVQPQALNPMEPIQENEILDSDGERSRSSLDSNRSIRSQRSPRTPGHSVHPPSIVLSPSPNDVPSDHRQPSHSNSVRSSAHRSPSRSHSQTAARWYQQFKNRISTPLPLHLQQQLTTTTPPVTQQRTYRVHGQSAPIPRGQQSGGHQAQSMALNLSPIAIETVSETPTHSKALTLLGVHPGPTPQGAVHSVNAKRISQSVTGRPTRSYAPPTTPIPGFFVHLYSSNRMLNRPLFPMASSNETMTPQHAESARADHHEHGDHGMSEKRDSELSLCVLSKSDPVNGAIPRPHSAKTAKTPKTPKSPFSRKKKENELSLLDVNGSPFPFEEDGDGMIHSAKSDGMNLVVHSTKSDGAAAVQHHEDFEPALERSKSSGHLRARFRSSIGSEDGNEMNMGLSVRSMSERARDDGTERRAPFPIQTRDPMQRRNGLTTPDVVHLFKVLSQNGLFPKQRVNDAEQLRMYHLKM